MHRTLLASLIRVPINMSSIVCNRICALYLSLTHNPILKLEKTYFEMTVMMHVNN